jgi:hypothetical protein
MRAQRCCQGSANCPLTEERKGGSLEDSLAICVKCGNTRGRRHRRCGPRPRPRAPYGARPAGSAFCSSVLLFFVLC